MAASVVKTKIKYAKKIQRNNVKIKLQYDNKDYKTLKNPREAGKMYVALVLFYNNIALADKTKNITFESKSLIKLLYYLQSEKI